ncbi:MAG: phage holin family protein [bacterium]|nr:phage holin family protein [bacterium]
MTLKHFVCALAGCAGGLITTAIGDRNGAMTTLLIFMALDYITGIVVAAVFGSSNKSEGGGLESRAGWKGLIRKGVTLMIVSAAHRLDLLIGADYIKNAVIIAFCANELISLIENAGLMGIPIPEVILNAVDILKKDSGNNGISEL